MLIKPFYLTGERVCDINCGENHTMAATDRGRVYSWGEGFKGKLGLGYHPDLKQCEHQRRPKLVSQNLLGSHGEVEHLMRSVFCSK